MSMSPAELTAALIGLWSEDSMYGPGAQSDEQIYFFPDGTGRRLYLNWCLCGFEEFTWTATSGDTLRLQRTYEAMAGSDPVDAAQPEEELKVSLQEEDTPGGARMLVLRIVAPNPDDNGTFGLVRREVDDLLARPELDV
jgi:hypothetical protein